LGLNKSRCLLHSKKLVPNCIIYHFI